MTNTTAAVNQAADAVIIDEIHLHSGDPGASGTDNLMAGTESAIVLGAASGGVRSMAAPLEIDVPASTVSHYSLWGDDTLKNYDAFPTPETYAAPGVARITTATYTAT